jgi:hypothetical protein
LTEILQERDKISESRCTGVLSFELSHAGRQEAEKLGNFAFKEVGCNKAKSKRADPAEASGSKVRTEGRDEPKTNQVRTRFDFELFIQTHLFVLPGEDGRSRSEKGEQRVQRL